MSTQSVQCGKCGAPIDEREDPAEGRKPCPTCGSTIRQFNVHITEALHLHDSVSDKVKHAGAKKAHIEGFAGDDLHRKSGKWMKKERLIDREKDQYKEVVTDPETGKVIHHCEEPLSKHMGHGSAKKK